MSKAIRAFRALMVTLLMLTQLLGSPAAAADLSVWSALRTVTVGESGMIEPALSFATGRTELETSTSDLIVEQSDTEFYLVSRSGGFLDLGAVELSQVPLLNGQFTARVRAVVGHVYLYADPTRTAKFEVIQATEGTTFNIPAITIRYATAAYGRADLQGLPDAGSVTLPTPGSGSTEAGSGSTSDSEDCNCEIVTIIGMPLNPTATVTGGKVVLSWTAANPAPAGGYYIYRGADAYSLPGTPLTDFPVLDTRFTDGTVQTGQTYYYVIEAVGGGRTTALAVTVVNEAPSAPRTRTVRFVENSTTAEVDGKQQHLDVPAQLVNNRMLVPLRFLGEALGAEIEFDAAEQRITYSLDGRTLVLWLGRTEAYLNGVRLVLDVPPTVIQDRALIPLRFVSENLGAVVSFDAVTRAAIISYAGGQGTAEAQPPADSGSTESTNVGGIKFGTYAMRIPGVAYASDISAYQSVLTVAAGSVTKSALQINADGTYLWASAWDGRVINGTWRAENGGILLLSGQEQKDWMVSSTKANSNPADDGDDIWVYTDSVWYACKLISDR